MKQIHNREDIIQTGLEMIWSRGFNATGIDAILKQAKIPKGSFYNFFSSKEAFCLEIIDRYLDGVSRVFDPIFTDASLPPLARIRKSFEARIVLFESYKCTRGCLLGNLGLEMSDQYEAVRGRIRDGLLAWEKQLSALLLEAQQKKSLSMDFDPDILAEYLIAAFQGALFSARVKKSSAPLRHFVTLTFDTFLRGV